MPIRHVLILALALGLSSCGESYDDDTTDADDDTTAQDDDTSSPDDDTADDDSAGDDDTTTGTTNHPPTTPEIHITPENPDIVDDLVCVVDVPSTDPDNDPVAYDMDWYRNGVLSEFTGDTVPASGTQLFEEWVCQARAFDGEDFSEAVSATIHVPETPYGMSFAAYVSATGGAAGGAATVQYEHAMIDDEYNEVCAFSVSFDSTYVYGMPQAIDFWENIDETIEWDSGTELSNSCPEYWADYSDNLENAYIWWLNPMAFVSCDQVAADPVLADTLVGIDYAGNLPVNTGVFSEFCDSVGNLFQSYYGTGPIEGIWLIPTTEGAFAGNGTFGYFPAQGGIHVDVWAFLGVLMAASDNPNEPVEGLEGDYLAIPYWLFIYG